MSGIKYLSVKVRLGYQSYCDFCRRWTDHSRTTGCSQCGAGTPLG